MEQEFLPITLTSEDKTTSCRYYIANGSKLAVIMVGGIGGGFDTPAKQLYPKLALRLLGEGVSALRVQFRYPTVLSESVHDVLVGAKFLENQGVEKLGLVGHSFGGAVVIQAAAALQSLARTVVTLATQGYGADAVADLSQSTSILLVHGSDDPTLSPENSRLVFRLAKEPKKLEVLRGNRHGLDESADKVFGMVHDWIVRELLK